MAEREQDDNDLCPGSDDEENLPDCGNLAEHSARSQKYLKMLRESETLGYPRDELLTDYYENRRAYSQFYSAWVACSLQFDILLEAGGYSVEQGNRTTFLFQPHLRRQAEKLWQKTCDLYDDFCEISRISCMTWGIDLNFNDVPWRNLHHDHINRQATRADNYTIYSIA